MLILLLLFPTSVARAEDGLKLKSESPLKLTSLAADVGRGVYWAHDSARRGSELVAFDKRGKELGAISIAAKVNAVSAVVVSDKSVYFLDGGKTRRSRDKGVLYRVKPDSTSGKAKYRSWDFAFPRGVTEFSAMFIKDGRVYLAAGGSAGGIYEFPREMSRNSVNKLTKVGDTPEGVVAGAMNADGTELYLRTAKALVAVDPATFKQVSVIDLPDESFPVLLTEDLVSRDVMAVSKNGVMKAIDAEGAPQQEASPTNPATVVPSPTETPEIEEPKVTEVSREAQQFGATIAVAGAALLALLAGVATLFLGKSRN